MKTTHVGGLGGISMLQTWQDFCLLFSLAIAKASTAVLFLLSQVGRLAVKDKDRFFAELDVEPCASVAASKAKVASVCGSLGEDPLTFRDAEDIFNQLIYMFLEQGETLIDAFASFCKHITELENSTKLYRSKPSDIKVFIRAA